ncbi:MAG TPA: YciI family protein [Gemmatimonadaceae bacterium]|nr:YciI family protein [Gemmatimonadaceae bacterium]
MTLYKRGRESTVPPTEQEMAAMGELIAEFSRAGVLITTDGLQNSSKGKRVSIDANGKFTITDGPFTETKEVVSGYAILQVKDMDEAVRLTKRFLQVVGEGESEIRLMHDAPAPDVKSADQFSASGANS